MDVLYEQEKQCGNTGEIDSGDKSKSEEQMNAVNEGAGSDGPVIKRWTTEEDLTEGVVIQRKTQSLADFTQGN